MPTTTNYGWTTPADTDLVKDGAGAIRTLGTSVDTTTKALNPSTTLGDIEYRSSTANTNTRLGIGSSGQVLTVAAGVPSWANGFSNPLTTTGDTIYSSSGTTPARLAIGSTGNILTVAGEVPTWAAPASAGGMTLITTTTFNDTATTYTYSSLGSYKHLMILLENASFTGSGVTTLALRFNGDTAANYLDFNVGATSNAFAANSSTGASFIKLMYEGLSGNGQANVRNGNGQAWIYDYAGSQVKYVSSGNKSNNQTDQRIYTVQGTWDNTAAITSLTLFTQNTTNFNSGTLKLYGVS